MGTQAATIRRNYAEAISGIAAPLSFLLVVVTALSIVLHNERFLSQDNWRIIIQSTAVVAILAVGETAVIITGGVDLSVGRVLAVSGVVAANAMVNHHAGIWTGVALACGTGVACGLMNGLLTNPADLNPARNEDAGPYERCVVVAHSLGAVVSRWALLRASRKAAFG